MDVQKWNDGRIWMRIPGIYSEDEVKYIADQFPVKAHWAAINPCSDGWELFLRIDEWLSDPLDEPANKVRVALGTYELMNRRRLRAVIMGIGFALLASCAQQPRPPAQLVADQWLKAYIADADAGVTLLHARPKR